MSAERWRDRPASGALKIALAAFVLACAAAGGQAGRLRLPFTDQTPCVAYERHPSPGVDMVATCPRPDLGPAIPNVPTHPPAPTTAALG